MWLNTCTTSLMFFFFKQKTAYEMRISDWSSDVCSSDLNGRRRDRPLGQCAQGRAFPLLTPLSGPGGTDDGRGAPRIRSGAGACQSRLLNNAFQAGPTGAGARRSHRRVRIQMTPREFMASSTRENTEILAPNKYLTGETYLSAVATQLS